MSDIPDVVSILATVVGVGYALIVGLPWALWQFNPLARDKRYRRCPECGGVAYSPEYVRNGPVRKVPHDQRGRWYGDDRDHMVGPGNKWVSHYHCVGIKRDESIAMLFRGISDEE